MNKSKIKGKAIDWGGRDVCSKDDEWKASGSFRQPLASQVDRCSAGGHSHWFPELGCVCTAPEDPATWSSRCRRAGAGPGRLHCSAAPRWNRAVAGPPGEARPSPCSPTELSVMTDMVHIRDVRSNPAATSTCGYWTLQMWPVDWGTDMLVLFHFN